MTRNQALLFGLLLLLMATGAAVWQFGPYGLYGGALVGLVVLSLTDVDEKGGSDG